MRQGYSLFALTRATRPLAVLLALAWLAVSNVGCDAGDDLPTGCTTLDDCPSGHICLNGVCVPPRQPDRDVTGGDSQETTGGCTRDEDCDMGFRCDDDGVCRQVGECSCDPDDPCTEFAPECQCDFFGDECSTDSDCDDDEKCTLNSCWCGYCETEIADLPECCASHADCDDGIPCSENRCEYLRCVNYFEPGCCAVDADCDNRDPCTIDRCVDHTCQHESLGDSCCTQDGDCDDGDACTRNYCVAGSCAHPRRADDPRCGCLSAMGCDDRNPCTTSECVNNLCTYSAVTESPPGYDCCRRDSDCDDPSDPSHRGYCHEYQCHSTPRVRCDEVDGDCSAAYVCHDAICDPDGWCRETEEQPNCCLTDSDCDDHDPCTKNECLSSNRCRSTVHLVEGCCLNDAHCDDGLDCTRGRCCLTEECSGQYGTVNRNHCYQVFDTSGSDECCRLDLECDDGLPCTLNVCWQGQCYNPLVEDTCCAEDADCDDGNPCTEDTCVDGTCQHVWEPGCCRDEDDCDDGDHCTINTCEDNRCRTAYIEGCCHHDHDCDDQDVCTEDRCVEGECVHTRLNPCCTTDAFCTSNNPCLEGRCIDGDCVFSEIPGCCVTMADCDDGDPCTINNCLSNRCHTTQSTAPECCELEVVWTNNGFEWGTASFEFEGWQVQNQSPNLGWQVVENAARANSPPYSMYYGSQTTGTYASGNSHQGVARTPEITLPDRDDIFAGFWTYMDYGDEAAYTSFRVKAHTGLGSTQLWTGASFGGSTVPDFRFVEVDLSPWRSQTVRLEFEFATEWNHMEGGEGVFVDDIMFGAGCFERPVECQVAQDCVDNDPCTVAECIDQRCSVLETSEHPTCCAPRLFTATFHDGSVQGLATGLLPGASPRYTWAPSSHRFASPPYSLYFGDPDIRCQDNPGEYCPAYGRPEDGGERWPGGTAELGPINLAEISQPILSFSLWTQIEELLEYDHFDVIVITLPNERETTVWTTRTTRLFDTEGQFVPIVVDLSDFASSEVRIRFRFVDTMENGYGFKEGVYIDNITVGQDCR